MNRGREGLVERDGLVFFGTLAASVTHELNNVLSIIDQTRGLLEDLAVGAASGRAIDPARLETIATRIDRQVRKGVEIMSCLNRFSHSLEDPAGSFDAGAETENLVTLARRFADLKQVRLKFTPSEEEVRGDGNAFVLQHSIFTCLQRALQESEEGDRIEVGVRRDADEAVVTVVASTRFTVEDGDPQILRLADVMKSLDGACRARTNEHGGTTFELRIPAPSAEASDPED